MKKLVPLTLRIMSPLTGAAPARGRLLPLRLATVSLATLRLAIWLFASFTVLQTGAAVAARPAEKAAKVATDVEKEDPAPRVRLVRLPVPIKGRGDDEAKQSILRAVAQL